MGTADVADRVIHAWVAELLASPTWGVVRYAKNAAAKRFPISPSCTARPRLVTCHPSPHGTRPAAHARAAARAISPTLDTSGLHAVRAAHQSTAIVNADNWVKLDAVTGHALRAHELAAGEFAAPHIVALTRRAISSWRRLAGLANPSEASARQADQPGRAAAERTPPTCPAHRIC